MRRRSLLLLTLALLIAQASAQPHLEFDTDAGDAWTFSLRLSGHVRDGRCESVTLRTPLATVTAVQPGRKDSEDILVLLNFSDREIEVNGADPKSAATLARFSAARSLMGERTNDRNDTAIRMGPMSAIILALQS